jgi:exodeoxyribonuclease III
LYAALGSRKHDHCDEKHRSPNRNMPEPLTFRGADAKEFPILLTPNLVPRLSATGVDSAHRGREKPSDHAPVWVQL